MRQRIGQYCEVRGHQPLWLQGVQRLLQDPAVAELDLVRLVMLYALRYERHSSSILSSLLDQLARRGVSERHRKVVMSPMVRWWWEGHWQSDRCVCVSRW